MSAAQAPYPFGPRVTLAATTGTPSITFGIQIVNPQDFIRTTFHPYWAAAVQVTRPAWDACMLLDRYKFRASYVRYLDDAKKISAGVLIPIGLHGLEIGFLAGGSWAIDHQTTVKARMDHHGNLEAILFRKINEKARLTVSGEFDLKNLSMKLGIWMALALDL